MKFFGVKEVNHLGGSIWSRVKVIDEDAERYRLNDWSASRPNWIDDFQHIHSPIRMDPPVNLYDDGATFKYQDIVTWYNRKGFSTLMNKKVKDVLESFILVPHRFYEAKVSIENEIRDYFIFHVLSIHNTIDYSQSKFRILTRGRKKEILREFKKGEIRDKTHYLEINSWRLKEYPDITTYMDIECASFSSYFDIVPGYLTHFIVISERVKNAMEAAGITGCEYQEVTNYTIEMPPLVD